MVSPKDVCDALDITVNASSDVERAMMLHEACAITGTDFTEPFFDARKLRPGSSLHAFACGLERAIGYHAHSESDKSTKTLGYPNAGRVRKNLARAAEVVIDQHVLGQSYRMEDIPAFADVMRQATKEDRGGLMKALAGSRSTFGLEPEVAYTAADAQDVIVDAMISIMYPRSVGSADVDDVPPTVRPMLRDLALTSLSSDTGYKLMGIMRYLTNMPPTPPTKPARWPGEYLQDMQVPTPD